METNQPKPLKFNAGATSTADYAEKFLTPLFESGIIPRHSTADYYTICFSDLCAYADRPAAGELGEAGQNELLAIWSHPVPDCAEDERLYTRCDFTGAWEPQ